MSEHIIIEIGYDDHVSFYKLSKEKAQELAAKEDFSPEQCNTFIVDEGEYIGGDADAFLSLCAIGQTEEEDNVASFKDDLKEALE